MTHIIPCEIDELKHVQSIAYRTWPDTFGKILSTAQIEYMLNWMYSLETLEKQLKDGHVFFLAEEGGEKLGFTGLELNSQPGKTKIHKIYILPSAQGKGIGKALFQKIKQLAKENHQTNLTLNVNKYNQSAIDFYLHSGFEEIRREVIDIGNGYVMDDIVYELKL